MRVVVNATYRAAERKRECEGESESKRQRGDREEKRRRGTEEAREAEYEKKCKNKRRKGSGVRDTRAWLCAYTRARTYTRACPPPPLCTTRDRELAPPRTRVGQSLLLTHTRRERAACALPCVRTCVCTRVSASSSSRGRARAGGSVKGASDDFRGFRASERAACRRRIYARSRNVT